MQGWNIFHINHDCIQPIKKPQISIENLSLVQGTSNKRTIIVVNTQSLIIKRIDFELQQGNNYMCLQQGNVRTTYVYHLLNV